MVVVTGPVFAPSQQAPSGAWVYQYRTIGDFPRYYLVIYVPPVDPPRPATCVSHHLLCHHVARWQTGRCADALLQGSAAAALPDTERRGEE